MPIAGFGILTKKIIADHVKARLGEGSINVELTQAQYDAALLETVSYLNRYATARRHGLLSPTGNGKYVLTQTTHPGILSVEKVWSVRNKFRSGDRIDLFDPLIYLSGNYLTDSSMSAYMQALNALKTARTLFSSELTWRQSPRIAVTPVGNDVAYSREIDLLVYVSVSTATFNTLGLTYLFGISADDSPQTGVAHIPVGLHQWTLDYATASAKLMLSRVLGKFGGLPTSTGDVMPMDSDSLSAEAQNAKDKLEDDLLRRKPSLPPLIA